MEILKAWKWILGKHRGLSMPAYLEVERDLHLGCANRPPLQVSLSKEELRKDCGERCECTCWHKYRLSSVQREGFSNTELCQRQNEQPQSLKYWLSKKKMKDRKVLEVLGGVWQVSFCAVLSFFCVYQLSYQKATAALWFNVLEIKAIWKPGRGNDFSDSQSLGETHTVQMKWLSWLANCY